MEDAMSHALATVRHHGRRPSVTPGGRLKNRRSREAATDNPVPMVAAHAATTICRPFRAGWKANSVSWGLRPRLSICRRFAARYSYHSRPSILGLAPERGYL
jgi:hypothetical protein